MELIVMKADELKELIAQVFRSELSNLSLAEPVKDEDVLMTIDEAATFLKLSKNTLYSMDIPAMKKGKRLYYSKHDLIAWLKTGRRKTTAEMNSEVDNVLLKIKRGKGK